MRIGTQLDSKSVKVRHGRAAVIPPQADKSERQPLISLQVSAGRGRIFLLNSIPLKR